MDFDDIEMTESFKFFDNASSNYQPSESADIKICLQMEYWCYGCGGNPSNGQICKVCKGNLKINNKNSMALLLSSYFCQKIVKRQKNSDSQKLLQRSQKLMAKKCEQIKQQEYSEQATMKCEICQQSCLQKNKAEDTICSDCTKNRKNILQRQDNYSWRIHRSGYSQQYQQTSQIASMLDRGILRDNLNLNLLTQSHRKKQKQKNSKFLSFSPTRSNGTISPEKSCQSSRVKIICDESDSQIDDKFASFHLQMNEVCTQNQQELEERLQSEEQFVNSSIKFQKYEEFSQTIENSEKNNLYFQDYYCDNCGNVPKQFRYHCEECEDYDNCQECYQKKIHHHRMTRVCKIQEQSSKREKFDTVRNTVYKNLLSILKK